MGYCIDMADTKVVPMRWPTDLLAEVDAVVERGGRTGFVLAAVRDRLAGGPLPVSEPSKREAEPEVAATDALAGAVKDGRRTASEFAAAVTAPLPGGEERCPHPKARRSRGQCMACFTYLDKPGQTRCRAPGPRPRRP